MSSNVLARRLTEEEYPRWRALVRESPEGSVYSTPEYLEVLCRATGGRFWILGAFRKGRLHGGVAIYEEADVRGRYVAPRLLLYYNGFVLRSFETRYPSRVTSRHLRALRALEAKITSQGWDRGEFKSRHPFRDARVFQREGWKVWPTYSYEVGLTDLEGLWTRTDQNARRLVKRCAADAMEVTEDEDFQSFHRMHMETHDRKGAPVYLPADAFREYVTRLLEGGLARLFHARLPGGRSVAAQLVLLGPHPVTHTVAAGADGEFLRTGASAFLRWKVFERLAEKGYEANDLTDASLNPVTRFKSQLGGDLVLSLNVARPPSVRFRTVRALDRWCSRLRGGVGALVGRMSRTTVSG